LIDDTATNLLDQSIFDYLSIEEIVEPVAREETIQPIITWEVEKLDVATQIVYDHEDHDTKFDSPTYISIGGFK